MQKCVGLHGIREEARRVFWGCVYYVCTYVSVHEWCVCAYMSIYVWKVLLAETILHVYWALMLSTGRLDSWLEEFPRGPKPLPPVAQGCGKLCSIANYSRVSGALQEPGGQEKMPGLRGNQEGCSKRHPLCPWCGSWPPGGGAGDQTAVAWEGHEGVQNIRGWSGDGGEHAVSRGCAMLLRCSRRAEARSEGGRGRL